MLITYFLQKLENQRESIKRLDYCYLDLKRETRNEIRELKKRLQLLEQSQSERKYES